MFIYSYLQRVVAEIIHIVGIVLSIQNITNQSGKSGPMATQTQVGAARAKFEQNRYPTFVVEYEGQRFTCFVLPIGLCSELPDFAYETVADDRTGITCPDEASVFGVCDTVAEEFRPFVALHEILEYWIGGKCGEATLKEVEALTRSQISPPRQIDYLFMRRAFFQRLIPFAKKSGYPEHKIEEFEASLKLFERLCDP